MSCASCHDSHGAERKLLKKTTVNEQCLECHAEYQGPFASEHAPVTEDCSICHEPHGTVANNLLRQEEPFLCLRCHRAHRNDPDAGSFPTNTALLTACSQCHGEVHGTDQPSRHSKEGRLP
jgi:DmsE family decaheme c-type cytochrome